MDERLQSAFETANYMATLSNQRRILQEEFKQKLFYYTNGGTFTVTPALISFAQLLIDQGHDTQVPFIDDNNYPVVIEDVNAFMTDIMSVYFEALNAYTASYNDIKSKRRVADIVKL